MEGDQANPDLEIRKSLNRPADDDNEFAHAVPNKMRKIDDDGLANHEEAELIAVSSNEIEGGIENDSDVDLGAVEEEEFENAMGTVTVQKDEDVDDDEEQLDLEGDYAPGLPGGEFDEEVEEGDTYDEDDDDELGTTAEELEDNIQEEADSSTEMDFVQTNLAYIEDCQSDIDTLNHKANEEILLVELKHSKLRLPIYKRRNNFISRVPHFWATVFSQHRQLKQVLTKEDVKCLKHVTKLQLEDFEDNRSGYSIQFYFSENPWFKNKVITKEYHLLTWHGSPSCSCTPIQWKKGMNLTMKSSSFFSWFTSQEDASADDIAEIIKDDLWPNPLQCFLMSNKQPDGDESDDDEEAGYSGNLNAKDDSVVLLDEAQDDDVEYISSEEEDEQEWPGEKVRGKTTQYLVEEDEGDEDEEYEEFEDDDVDVTGTSSVFLQPRTKVQEKGPKTAEVISIDDDYLGSEEEDESEYFDGAVDLDGEEKLLQGQVENEDEFEEAESPKESTKTVEDRLFGEVEIQNADSSHDPNEDSHQSNGVVGSSTVDGPEQSDAPNQNELETATAAKIKIQDQSKVVSTSTTGDSDITAGGT